MSILNSSWIWLKTKVFGDDPRNLWRRYVIAVIFVALSLVFSNIAPKAQLNAVEANAEIIDTAGRQRMLSQRILYLSALAASQSGSDETSHFELRSAIVEFEAAQTRLSQTRANWLAEKPNETHAELNAALDKNVARFIAMAKSIESADEDLKSRPRLEDMIGVWPTKLLAELDDAVQRDEQYIVEQVRYVHMIANACLVLAFIILFLEAVFIFLPAHRGVLNFLKEREAHEAALTAKNEELEHFTYIASHDLRGPLRGLENLIGWVEEDIENQDYSETLSRTALIKNRVFRMNGLLSDMLAFSRIGRGKVDVTTFDLKPAIEETLNWIDRPDGFEFNLDPNLPTLNAPLSTLQQIFLNLLNNTVKHHDKDVGRVDVKYKSETNSHVIFVSDDGPGIAAEYRDYIFKPFHRLAPRDDVEGSGMGLAISRKLVTSLGGEITLEDIAEEREGRGTTFRISIPKNSTEATHSY